LFLCELWFLVHFGELSKNIIYVGAAPGSHISYLSMLFKSHKFYLYDPNDFKLEKNDRLILFQQCFTDKDAEFYQQTLKV
jgi:cap2 methyltransferase